MFREDEEVRVLLDELGLRPREIVETIMTTRGSGGELNAAPMGVLRGGPRALEIRPFLDTRTYRNLRDTGRGVVNITGDVELFLETAFKRGGARSEWFEEDSMTDPPALKEADAFLFISVLRETRFSERRAKFLCRAEWGRVRTSFPRAFSRGFSAAIEAIIHATRIEAFIREGKREEFDELHKRFKICREIVERVSPEDSPNRRVLRALEAMVGDWMRREWK